MPSWCNFFSKNKNNELNEKLLEEQNNESPSPNSFSRAFKTLADKVENTGYLGIAVYYNLWRDFWWTYFTCMKLNGQFRNADNWDEQNEGQWLWGTVAMSAGFVLHYLACKAANKSLPFAKSLVAMVSASLAIPGWNWAGLKGIEIGENSLNLDPEMAGYFAGLFTGMAEGPIQEAVTSLGTLLADPAERKKFQEDPKNYLKEFAKRFGLSMTLGNIPGDVWQWVFNAAQTYNLPKEVTSACVALAVGTCNIAYAKTQETTLKSPCCRSNKVDNSEEENQDDKADQSGKNKSPGTPLQSLGLGK